MRFTKSYIACSSEATTRPEVPEIEECIDGIPWGLLKQGDYNAEFKKQFAMRGWKSSRSSPGRKRPDFAKNGVIVEVQFGNRGVIFNDLMKFNYDYVYGDLQLGVFIAPTDPRQFLPDTPKDITGMTSFQFVEEYLHKGKQSFQASRPYFANRAPTRKWR